MSKNFIPVADVANFFLMYASKDEEAELITNLKLQKLVYYAQGFHLAIFDKILFGEKVMAWRHGPVVQELYNTYKCHGGGQIPLPPDAEKSIDKFTEEQRELLSDIYQTYGQYTAWRLRDMTHEEAPWLEADRKRKNLDDNIEITKEALKDFFKTRLVSE